LLDIEVQRHCQLWCADAQLLLYYLRLAATAHAASTGEGGGFNRSGFRLPRLQELLQPYLEQQQLLAVVCWGAGQCYSCCQFLLHEDQQQQQQDQHQQQQQGLLAHKVAACCLSMHMSGVCLALLEALLLSGCVHSQRSWLQHQLQQQANLLAQQQQQQYGASAECSSDAGLQCFVGQCVGAGALQALAHVRVTEGVRVGRVEGLGLTLLQQVYGGDASGRGVTGGDVCEPLQVLPRLQQLLNL
jgi:uncharacterized membrane protein